MRERAKLAAGRESTRAETTKREKPMMDESMNNERIVLFGGTGEGRLGGKDPRANAKL